MPNCISGDKSNQRRFSSIKYSNQVEFNKINKTAGSIEDSQCLISEEFEKTSKKLVNSCCLEDDNKKIHLGNTRLHHELNNMMRNMSHFNEIIYKKDLEELKRLDILKHKTVNEMLNTFHEKLLEIIDKNAPFRTLSKREKKLREKPWITKGILQSIRIKNNLYNRYIRKQDQFWYHRYKFYRSKVNMLICKSKKKKKIKKLFPRKQQKLKRNLD